MVWTALQKYSTMFIQFISGIILARLLTPHDYGCIGMLSIFMVLAEAFIDGGFGSALIQKKKPTQADYSTIFFWNVFMSIIMYSVLYVTAPAIARFYNIPLLCDVLRMQGLVLFIYAFNIVQRNQLRKKLNFKILSKVTIVTSITSLAITIFLAYHGFGVWSLVANNIVSAAIPAFVFWFYFKWRPIWSFSWQSFRELFSFGFYMFLTHLVNSFGTKIVHLVIGKVFSTSVLGFYSKAIGTEQLASRSISSVVSQVSYPLYVQIQDDKKALGNMIKRMTMTISFLTFPLMALLMLTATPLFALLYSERWLPSVPYFQIICLVGLSECLQAVNTQTIAAIGKSQTMFRWAVIKRTLGLLFILGGLYLFDMKGLLAGVVIFNWLCYFVNIALVSKYIGYVWYKQLSDLFPITVITVFAVFVSLIIAHFCHFNMYFDGFLKFMIFTLIYIGWIIMFKPESYQYFLTIVPSKFKFSRRHE